MTYLIDQTKFQMLNKLSSPFREWNAKGSVEQIKYFDWAEYKVAGFFNYLKLLCLLGDDHLFYFYAPKPDPVNYFFFHFQKYPLIEFDITYSEEDFSNALCKDPGDSPADALMYRADEIIIFPESLNWYIYGEYDIELAKLVSKVGFPPNSLFPHDFISEKEAKRLIALKDNEN